MELTHSKSVPNCITNVESSLLILLKRFWNMIQVLILFVSKSAFKQIQSSLPL